MGDVVSAAINREVIFITCPMAKQNRIYFVKIRFCLSEVNSRIREETARQSLAAQDASEAATFSGERPRANTGSANSIATQTVRLAASVEIAGNKIATVRETLEKKDRRDETDTG